MQKSETWELTIGYWPNATKAGVRPVINHCFYIDDGYQGYYRPNMFNFLDPPSREDFANLVRQTPWLQGADILPVLEKNDWPMIDSWHKAASVALLDDKDAVVGEVRIQRQILYHGEGYLTAPIDVETERSIVNRLPKAKREDARHLISERANYIREQVSQSDLPLAQGNLAYAIRHLLHEAGILKTKPRKPAITA